MKRERTYNFGSWSLITGDNPVIETHMLSPRSVNSRYTRLMTLSTQVEIDRQTAADMLFDLKNYMDCHSTSAIRSPDFLFQG